jgi:N-acetylglucosamine kinase-like BadF-type ATPase
MRLYLGIDGGQSGTTALIGDPTGRVLGTGRAGPCNHAAASEGRRKFTAAITASLSQAARAAGLTQPASFEAACLGLSGGPDDKDALAREMIPAGRYLITHDAQIALAGATAGQPGIIAIAGTGSIVFGRNAAGVFARAGGWGYVFGDEGGAFDLVRQALRAILRHTDEYPRDRVARWAPLVDQAARAGDTVASDILASAAQALATMTGAVRAQLFGPSEAMDVCYSGGVFGSDPFRERFRMLVELQEGARVSAPRLSAAEGALIEAYRLCGISPQPVLRRFPDALG